MLELRENSEAINEASNQIMDAVLKDVAPYRSSQGDVSRVPKRQLREMIISAIVLLLSVRTSREIYDWIEYKRDDEFDAEKMEAVGGSWTTKDLAKSTPKISFTVSRGLARFDGKGDVIDHVVKANVYLQPKPTFRGAINPWFMKNRRLSSKQTPAKSFNGGWRPRGNTQAASESSAGRRVLRTEWKIS
jgi:hypothetical protein